MARQKAITVGGIYAIRCSVNGKVYVGDAKAVNMRWNNHTSALKRGIHQLRELQKDWDKYGPHAFSVELLQECHDKAERRRLEPGWIAKLEATNPDKGYNISVSGNGRNKIPENERLSWDLHVRFDENLKAVVQQVMIENRCSTPSELMRVLLERECRRVTEAPEQFKLNF